MSGPMVSGVPSTVSLNLDGETNGASFAPSAQILSLANDGLSGTATFAVTAGVSGALLVDATLVANNGYATG